MYQEIQDLCKNNIQIQHKTNTTCGKMFIDDNIFNRLYTLLISIDAAKRTLALIHIFMMHNMHSGDLLIIKDISNNYSVLCMYHKNDVIFPDYSIDSTTAVFDNQVRLQEFPLNNYWDL